MTTLTAERKHKRPLPPGWRWVRLGDKGIASVIMGQSPPSSTYTDKPVGLPFYQGKADFGELHPVPTVWCTNPNRIAEPGDILLSVRAPVGPTNIANERCCIGRGLAAIRPKPGTLLSYYLLAVLRYLEPELARSGSGSTFSAIVREQIEAISFPLPTPDEQRIIVTRLEAQMAEVQRLRQAAERQLEAARALFGALLRRVFRYKEGDPLPAGWRWVRLGEISAKRVDTCSPKEKFPDTFIYVDISSIDNVQKRIVSPQVLPAREAPSRARQIIKTGDILVATTRPNLNGVALVPPELDNQICSTGFCVLRIPDENLARLVFAYVQSPTFVAIVSRLVQGALYPAITDDDVKKCRMPLPSPEEWHTIVARLEAQVAEVQRLRKAAERQLEAIYALPGALLGEVFGGYEPGLGPGD